MKKITISTLFFICSLIWTQSAWSQSTARYTITVNSVWNSTDHGTLPGNAHWSDLVGATHNADVTFWELGQLASVGIENVAESGDNVVFNNEVDAAIIANDADQWLQTAFSPFAAISTATLSNVFVSENYPLLTLASMVAPSPDWFIGVNSYSLLDGGNNWKDNINIDLFVYDAGTEEGTGYSTQNSPSNPHINIFSRINMTPFNDQRMAYMTLTLEEVLSDPAMTLTEGVRISPNPVSDRLRISNNSRIAIGEISIYDLLGNLVHGQSDILGLSSFEIDLSALSSGMYMVNLRGTDGSQLTKKLVVR